MHVIFFDIDGTLLVSGSAGQVAIVKTLKHEFAIDQPARVPIHGQTDRGIAGSFFAEHGINNSEETWLTFRDSYLSNLPSALQENEGRLLPGVPEILEKLAARDDVAIGLLTGNTQEGALKKVEHYGIAQYFHFGGYGDVHPVRDDVARAAMKSAEAFLGASPDPKQTWVIGDTPNDIKCARAIGANVMAVATGDFSTGVLAASSPDVCLEDMSDVDLVAGRLTDST